MASLVTTNEAIVKFGRAEGTGIRCGSGYDSSPYGDDATRAPTTRAHIQHMPTHSVWELGDGEGRLPV